MLQRCVTLLKNRRCESSCVTLLLERAKIAEKIDLACEQALHLEESREVTHEWHAEGYVQVFSHGSQAKIIDPTHFRYLRSKIVTADSTIRLFLEPPSLIEKTRAKSLNTLRNEK